MNQKIAQVFNAQTLGAGVLAVLLVGFSLPATAFAQYSGDGSCCGDAGYTDYSSIDPSYTDYSYSNPGYTDYSYSNPGYTDYSYSSPGYTDYSYSNPGYTDYSSYSPSYTDYSTPSTDIYGNSTYDSGGVGYSYNNYGGNYGGSYYMPSYYGSGYGYMPSYYGGYGYSNPGYSFSAPSSYYTQPVAYSAPQQQQQQQQQQQASAQPINIVNNNVNTNTNTNTNTPATTVTPVISGSVQYPAVYTQPTYYQPTYYQQPTYVSPAPTCTINLSGYNGYGYGAYGNQLATLTWSSSYGTSATIYPNIGSVAVSGSQTVYPVNGQSYTMTVYGPGGSSTCVSAPYYVQPIVYNNPAPSVTLNQIPYTGFDFGFLGDSLYWLALFAFAAAGAYLMVYYRGGAMTLATAMVARRTAMKPVAALEKAVAATAQTIEEKVVEPVRTTLEHLPVLERYATRDSMTVVQAKKEHEMPRIVINRS